MLQTPENLYQTKCFDASFTCWKHSVKIRTISIEKVVSEDPYVKAEIKEINEVKPSKENKEFAATIDSIKDIALKIEFEFFFERGKK